MGDPIIDLAVARAAKNREETGDLVPAAEAYRIIGLPRMAQPSPKSPEMRALIEKWTNLLKRPGVQKVRPLLWSQAWAMEAMYHQAQSSSPVGLAGNLGVGSGKTLIAMLAGHKAVFNSKRTLILTKKALLEDLKNEQLEWSKEYAFPHFQAMTYGSLSSKKGEQRMKLIRPEVIVCDEGHLLKALTSARTGRFIRYFNENPGTRLVVITGTFMSTTIMDLLHLLYLSLREGSPAPHPESHDAKTWASCIDEDSEPFNKDFYDMEPLIHWTGRELTGDDVEEDKETCRKAFFDRIATTPGFVFTTAPSCSAPLHIAADRGVDITGPIEDALRQLADEYRLPNGEDVLDALAMHRASRQLSMGFYMRWAWEKTKSGQVDKPWMEARKGWAGACRAFLKATSHPGLDTPGLIQDAIIEGRPVHPDLVHAWERWAPEKGKPEPPTEVVWVDMAPLLHAHAWLMRKKAEGEPALLWWESTSALRPVLEGLGIRTYGAGDSANRLRRELIAAPSQKVFGTGFNGQKFTHHLILEPTSNPGALEQLLGRSHRTGREDPVFVDVAQWAWPLRKAWDKAYRRAQALQATMGQQQRVLHAELTGFPKVLDE